MAVEVFERSDFTQQSALAYQSRLQPPPPRQKDEIDELGKIFAQMADRIHQKVQQLKQTGQLRRELIANVSHVLRTPLTSLQARNVPAIFHYKNGLGFYALLMLRVGYHNRQDNRRLSQKRHG